MIKLHTFGTNGLGHGHADPDTGTDTIGEQPRPTEHVGSDLDGDPERGHLVGVETLEDEHNLDGTPAAGKDDHHHHHHARHLLLRLDALAAHVAPRYAAEPEALQHQNVQYDDDDDRQDVRKEEKHRLVEGVVVVLADEVTHAIVEDAVGDHGGHAEHDDDCPEDQYGAGGIRHRTQRHRADGVGDGQITIDRHQHELRKNGKTIRITGLD